jgi:hypothetical protein
MSNIPILPSNIGHAFGGVFDNVKHIIMHRTVEKYSKVSGLSHHTGMQKSEAHQTVEV